MQDIRNIAVIAHVDHGKTTLVDKMMLAGKLFRDGQDNSGEVLDSNDLERERGITILSKNVSINWKGTKINILDTPGHSDFGGEVERVLNMADGCLLLVDAFEGPMPQTRFVLQKALQLGLKPIVVVNKVDKPNCRPEEVYEMVFDLMCDLDATEDQLDFPVVYGSAKNGWMGEDYNHPTDNIDYLLDKIIEVIPAPKQLEGTPQLLITSLDYSSYTGRIAVGRVHRGTLKDGMNVTICHRDGTQEKTKIKELHTFEGMGHKKTDHVDSGDICAVVGLEKFEIGDTICDFENPEPLPPIAVDEPTMSMLFTINDSPFFGKEGKFCTSRHIQERLNKELEKNLALRVQPYEDSTDKWIVSGRGVLHLSVLIETMRREGYELQVGQPQVIYKEIDGVKCEPVGGVCSNSVIGGHIQCVVLVGSLLADRGQVVGIRESVLGNGDTLFLQILLDLIHLILAVCLSRAVQQANLLGLRHPLHDHLSLLIQRGQIGSAGDIAAHNAVEIGQAQSHTVLGNRGAQHRNGVGGRLRSLQGRSGVCHDQIHTSRNKAVGNGSAGCRIALCVLEIESNILTERCGQSIFKTLSGGIQSGMLHQLADANGEFLAVSCGRGCCRRCRRTAAGSQSSCSTAGSGCCQKRTTSDFTHNDLSPLSLCLRGLQVPRQKA